MSKHNYSQYSNKNSNNNERTPRPNPKPVTLEVAEVKPVVIHEEPVVTPTPVIMEETVKTVTLPETVEGVVVNCGKLNVRENPSVDAEVVCVLDAMSEIEINISKSTKDWFHVCTAIGVEGYCMRKFIDARL